VYVYSFYTVFGEYFTICLLKKDVLNHVYTCVYWCLAGFGEEKTGLIKNILKKDKKLKILV